MANFKNVILDKDKLAKELANLTPIEGNLALENWNICKGKIPSVSPELLEMLHKEGLSLENVKPIKPTDKIEEFSFYVDGDTVTAKKSKRGRTAGDPKGKVVAYADLTKAQQKQAADLYND